MKNLLFVLSIIGCILIVLVGHFYYSQKLDSIATHAQEEQISSTSTATTEEVEHEQEPADEEETIAITGILKEATSHKQQGEAINITAFGSVSLSNGIASEKTWPNLMTSALVTSLPEQTLNTTVIDVDDIPTSEVIEGDYVEQVITSNPDLLLFEPFVFNDNGVLSIDDTLYYLEQIITELESKLPETTIVLMPPNPIFKPTFYAQQIEALQDFAEENEYLYANHWQNWPNTDDATISELLENNRPNEQGHQVWADFMVPYLLNE
ncbi:SGNH/GDSL hydrolase family protein [Bacillus suaedae]|uniref:SGNH/GDSL hydrolase family protein n=1 Tax=Halalkalibacter suaedae TaxID=2822140 RepID=A0A940WTW3_9BACI|nr:SGNH/GDSL hydrolase family protein [Bacillus suaedae]MBP3950133.1 SGNH/GDSL hydrolase family protein [Bacillus suaedae]